MTGLILQIIGLDNEDFVIHFYIERDKMVSYKKSELVKVYPEDGVKYYAMIDGLERGHLICRVEIVDHEAFWSEGKRPVVISGYTGYDIGLCGGEGNTLSCGEYKVSFDAVQNIPADYAPFYIGAVKEVDDYAEITAEMVKGLEMCNSMTLCKELQVEEGDRVVVAVPYDKRMLVAYKDNGIGGMMQFSTSIMGANGLMLMIDDVPYRVFGEFMSVGGTLKLFIE
jgi:hypothetical protein